MWVEQIPKVTPINMLRLQTFTLETFWVPPLCINSQINIGMCKATIWFLIRIWFQDSTTRACLVQINYRSWALFPVRATVPTKKRRCCGVPGNNIHKADLRSMRVQSWEKRFMTGLDLSLSSEPDLAQDSTIPPLGFRGLRLTSDITTVQVKVQGHHQILKRYFGNQNQVYEHVDSCGLQKLLFLLLLPSTWKSTCIRINICINFWGFLVKTWPKFWNPSTHTGVQHFLHTHTQTW